MDRKDFSLLVQMINGSNRNAAVISWRAEFFVSCKFLD